MGIQWKSGLKKQQELTTSLLAQRLHPHELHLCLHSFTFILVHLSIKPCVQHYVAVATPLQMPPLLVASLDQQLGWPLSPSGGSGRPLPVIHFLVGSRGPNVSSP